MAIPADSLAQVPEGDGAQTLGTALQSGDAVRVEIWREPDLSGVFDVDDMGVVTFPLLGDRLVAGASPDSLRRALVAEYREYLQNPSIDVTLLRTVSILGEVRTPGLYPVDATVTLIEALALAGGVSPNGNQNDIRLVRNGDVIRQDMDVATVIGSSEVQSGDQIVVGEKSWASRHTGAIIGSLIAATAIIGAALISN
ncbi:MAG: polysaccharide export protein [Gammaproteobacteria bacterium]